MGVGALVALGQAERAKGWIARTILVDFDNSNMRYNLACALVELGDLEVGLDLLEPLLETFGRERLEYAKIDPDLNPVRDHPRLQAVITRSEARQRS